MSHGVPDPKTDPESVPKLDWSSADVHDAKLTVALDGKPLAAWKQSFETTVKLLPGGDWEEVKLKKHAVHVSGVRPGSEDKLRHYLESAVLQANASLESEQDSSERKKGRKDGRDKKDRKDENPVDSELTERFRSFAKSPPDDQGSTAEREKSGTER